MSTTPTPEPVSMPPTFAVEQIAENTRDGDGIHAVQVGLSPVEWRQLVSDLARRLFRLRASDQASWWLILAAGQPGDSLSRQDSLTRLVALLGEPLQWTITPQEAAAMSAALDEAAQEPTTCACGLFIEQPSQLNELTGCSACHTRGEMRVVRGAP